MNKMILLEDFEHSQTLSGAGQTHQLDSQEIEAIRLSSYEKGYSAGWDDALKEADGDKSRIEAEFARNLEDLGFTFHEAKSHVLHSLEPLLTALVESFLPDMLQETIGVIVNEEFLRLAEGAADAPIEIRVAKGNRQILDPLMGHASAVPIEICEDETLLNGQIFLRSSTAERNIDMSSALERIKSSVSAFYDLNEKAFEHG